MQRLRAASLALLSGAAHALEHHPKQVTVAIAVLMLGAGGGAFAVASLGPDPSALPVSIVSEDVEPLPLQTQSDALEVHSFSLYSADMAKSTDTAEALLARLGINDAAAAAFLRQDSLARTQLLANGRSVRAEADDTRHLERLTARWAVDETQFKRLIVERDASGRFASRVEMGTLAPSLRMGNGLLRTSLFAAVDEARLPDAVATQLTDIFSGQIDFHRHLRRGDSFAVLYETLEADGEPLRTGRVVSAEFVNRGRTMQAMWFAPPGERGGYFDFDGQSLERSFLASPMEVTRVTSGFAMRFHPIHHTWKQHMGVDYGAPSGAPVRSIGDGRVQFAGWMGGYGNVVQVDHGQGDATLYAHLSRIEVRQGGLVQRGQRIGAVGATGWATGPHLHFEFRENGVQKDPIEVARNSPAVTLSAQARPAFNLTVRAMRSQLAAASSTQVASAR